MFIVNTLNNYIKNNSLYILNDLNPRNTNQVIGDLKNLVFKKHPTLDKDFNIEKITTPYEINYENAPVIDIFINSISSDFQTYSAISTILAIAKSKGILIRTTVMQVAGAMNSLLAIQGTPGLRIMHENAVHYIPHIKPKPNVGFTSKQDPTTEIKLDMNLIEYQILIKSYKANTNMNKHQINNLIVQGAFNSTKSLKLNMCDWILLNNGNFIKRNTRQK